MIKIIIVILTLSVVLNMVNGISVLKDTYYWRTQYFVLEWDSLKEELAFIKYNYGGIIPWLSSKFKKNTASTISTARASSVPILLYHGVISNSDWKPDQVNTSLNDFRDQMFALKRAGWQTITVEDYIAFMQGKKQLPEKSFMLTFDDGRKDSYYNADPVLRALSYKAVMNIITGRSLGAGNEKGTFHLSALELRHMALSGRWEMESHTRSGHNYETIGPNGEQGHFLSDKLWLASQRRLETDDEYRKRVTSDLSNAKDDLEKGLGMKVLAFAYPFGDFGQGTQNFPASQEMLLPIVRSIYPISFYQAGSGEFPNNYYGEDPFLTKRININSPLTADDLLKMLNGSQDKPINYKDDFSQNNGWLQGWGSFDISHHLMTIGSSDTDDSALTFLGGSYLWKNYFMESIIRMAKGNALAIVARYKNENSFVSCDYSQNNVALTQRANKVDRPDIETTISTNLSGGREARVGIYANNDTATCYLDGKKIVSGPLDPQLIHGGLGFKTWTTDQNGTTLVVENLKVSAVLPAGYSQ